jgi:hypothetical protein
MHSALLSDSVVASSATFDAHIKARKVVLKEKGMLISKRKGKILPAYAKG